MFSGIVEALSPVQSARAQGQLVQIEVERPRDFTDIKNGHRSWWMPFIIVVLTGAFLFTAITKQVTWKTVYENQQKAAPEFAKRMQEQMPPEQKAAADRRGPISQEVTWAISPLGLLGMNAIAALILWPTINFGFGGKATFGCCRDNEECPDRDAPNHASPPAGPRRASPRDGS